MSSSCHTNICTVRVSSSKPHATGQIAPVRSDTLPAAGCQARDGHAPEPMSTSRELENLKCDVDHAPGPAVHAHVSGRGLKSHATPQLQLCRRYVTSRLPRLNSKTTRCRRWPSCFCAAAVEASTNRLTLRAQPWSSAYAVDADPTCCSTAQQLRLRSSQTSLLKSAGCGRRECRECNWRSKTSSLKWNAGTLCDHG